VFDAGEGGTSSSAVVINSYGTGRATITCNTGGASAVWIHNTGGFSISNLNLVNTRGTKGGYYGIELANDLAGGVKKTYFRFDSLDISGFSVAGIALHAEPSDKNPATGFSDVRITNVAAHGNRDAGIESWSNRDVSTAPTSYNFDSIYVGSSSAYSNAGIPGKGNNSGNGISFGEASNVTIEYCSAHDNGTSNDHIGGGPVGIWVYQTANALIQFNESYNNSRGSGDSDGGGFDLDGGVSNSTVQYNYSHNNDGAGVLVFQYAGGRELQNNTVRYNVSVNDARKATMARSRPDRTGRVHPAANVKIYGNTIYMNATTVDSSAVQSGLRFWNGGQRDQGLQQHRLHHRWRRPTRQRGARQPRPGTRLQRLLGPTATRRHCSSGTAAFPQYTEGGATIYTSFAAFPGGNRAGGARIVREPATHDAGLHADPDADDAHVAQRLPVAGIIAGARYRGDPVVGRHQPRYA